MKKIWKLYFNLFLLLFSMYVIPNFHRFFSIYKDLRCFLLRFAVLLRRRTLSVVDDVIRRPLKQPWEAVPLGSRVLLEAPRHRTDLPKLGTQVGSHRVRHILQEQRKLTAYSIYIHPGIVNQSKLEIARDN